MCGMADDGTDASTGRPPRARGDARRRAIQQAAIEQFIDRGIRATSMASIAEAAGVSRPALYQYYDDKAAIFAAAFVGLFEEVVDAALEALDGGDVERAGTVERLDGFLQRFDGDLWQRTAASAHIDEILEAKDEGLSAAVAAVLDRLWLGLDGYLRRLHPGRGRAAVNRRADWLELLRLSPKGLRYDQPTVEAYRRRLTALAATVAADIDAARAAVNR